MDKKPLGRKAYGSIGHLPDSRLGPADHHVAEGQARICTEQARDWRDIVIVQEKLDGSCCSVANVDGEIVALGRSGYTAASSPHEQHHMFAEWVETHRARFSFLRPGERCVGEWMALAHGTRYEIAPRAAVDRDDVTSRPGSFDPFVAFDIMAGTDRTPTHAVMDTCTRWGLDTPRLISYGAPVSVAWVRKQLQISGHGAIDPVEGAVWRVERRMPNGKHVVDFLAKWVREGKEDGCYLPDVSGEAAVWNWTP